MIVLSKNYLFLNALRIILMMRKTFIPVLFLIVPWANSLSQELSHQVLVPLAGVEVSGNISYSQTVGETAVQIVQGYDHILTQGFQQPSVHLKKYEVIDGTGILIYPNPMTDYLIMELYGERAKTILIEIINFTGRVVYSHKEIFTDGFYYRDNHNVQDLLSGLYLVRITTNDGMLNRVYKIEKL
jgi:hypothetical protein